MRRCAAFYADRLRQTLRETAEAAAAAGLTEEKLAERYWPTKAVKWPCRNFARVVIDTNVLLSAALCPNGVAGYAGRLRLGIR
jgi:hypothetical protein